VGDHFSIDMPPNPRRMGVPTPIDNMEEKIRKQRQTSAL